MLSWLYNTWKSTLETPLHYNKHLNYILTTWSDTGGWQNVPMNNMSAIKLKVALCASEHSHSHSHSHSYTHISKARNMTRQTLKRSCLQLHVQQQQQSGTNATHLRTKLQFTHVSPVNNAHFITVIQTSHYARVWEETKKNLNKSSGKKT